METKLKTNRTPRLPACALAAIATVAYLIAGPIISRASAPPAFGNASLKGSYSVLLTKWRSDPSSSPEALVGVFNFDGAGNLAISSFTDNNNGNITTGSGTGGYSVNRDGTGVMTVGLSNGDNGTFSIVINAKGKGFQLMLTECNNGCGSSILSGTAIATGGASFGNASLKGAHEFSTTTWTTQNSSAQIDLGILTFDGAGNVKASVTQDSAGTVTTIKANGTYSVNSDGGGSIVLTSKQGSTTFAFAIDSAGKGLQLIKAVSGDSVQSGTTTQQ
jgi:hypothetical protein